MSELDLTDKGLKIENRIDLTAEASNYENVRALTGEKVQLKASSVIINGSKVGQVEISTRGQSTLFFPRKSLSFDLVSDGEFRHGDKKESLKKFNLISLSMDRNYSCNRLAFGMMEEIKLFDLFYAYCDLRINGKSEGIYLVIEKPEEWALKKKNSPFLINRGYNNNIDKLKAARETNKQDIRTYKQYFNEIYRSVNRYDGEELYEYLSVRLDLEEYMKWLSFNFLVRNGDYTDEVYFYIDPGKRRYNIIPWDYDDLFSALPHEGREENRKELGDKPFFSLEDALDRKIVSDPVLYNKYLISLKEVLTTLTVEKLKNIFEMTYAELYPYYSDYEIIGQVKYDLHKNADLEILGRDLRTIYMQLVASRQIYLNYVEEKIR